ncbi:hypothetical protein RIF23_08165 [Lipingzhangella sp. LS1_29]|uniref:Uncharacterized protein n=1 Tax=Lipingzhangella rawalii TaxID=2055835 RepID=A0ABU2H4P0_9ACTN|nr:hypothetical protein [Lipingzhangella rawalii]MDS1270266.1 hypothetical protein [Lipingzhangella rawalii]
MAEQQLPADWPASVHPPGTEAFEQTAVVWLFEHVPPDYRLHGVLRRYPVALARLAREHVTACLEAARGGYRGARVALRDHLPPPAIEQVMNAYLAEGKRMAATLRSIVVVDEALRNTSGAPEE